MNAILRARQNPQVPSEFLVNPGPQHLRAVNRTIRYKWYEEITRLL